MKLWGLRTLWLITTNFAVIYLDTTIMIAYLRGTIDTLTPTNAYVDCSGVGYDVNISLSTYDTLHGLAVSYTHLRAHET